VRAVELLMPQFSDEVIRQARERRQQQVFDCSRRAAKKILSKMKSGRPSEATLAELIAGEFEEFWLARNCSVGPRIGFGGAVVQPVT